MTRTWRARVWAGAAISVALAAACSSFSGATEPAAADGGDASTIDTSPPPPPPGADDGSTDGGLDASSPYAAAILAAQPIAYWRMGRVEATIIPDEIGHNDRVLQGSGYQVGVPGVVAGDTAIRFDGVGSWAIASDPRALDFPGPKAFTIECWVKRDPTPPAGSYFLHVVENLDGTYPNPRSGYLLYTLVNDAGAASPGTFFEYDVDAGDSGAAGDKNTSVSALPKVGTFVHLAITADASGKMILYVDGTASVGAQAKGALVSRGSIFSVGGEPSGSRFPGAIDEVAVYDRVLGVAELAAHRALVK